MSIYDRIKKAYRKRELSRLLGQETPSAERVREAAELVIRRARKDEASGVRKDRWLFEFESSIEEVMDSVMHLSQDGQTEVCREIYEKLYDFAVYAMEDTYMPLYIYILYRYANTLLETGDAEKALPLFEKLVAKTDRLIGIHNPYGIHCYERVATAAAQSGDVERARKARESQQLRRSRATWRGPEKPSGKCIRSRSKNTDLAALWHWQCANMRPDPDLCAKV